MNIASIIAAFAAPLTIIATVVTTWLTRGYDLKQKQLEFYETRRMDAINAFAESFAKLHSATATRTSAIQSVLAATYLVMPYVPETEMYGFEVLIEELRSGAELTTIYQSFDYCLNRLVSSTELQDKSRRKVRLKIPKVLRH